MNKNYLVLDQGGHATRALVFSQAGDILFHCESPISLIEKPDNIVEHNPEEMVNSFKIVLTKIQEYIVRKNILLTAAGLATQRSSFICINKVSRDALTPIISWQDRRAYKDINNFEIHAEKIFSRTGLILNPHYGASKMRWCLQNINAVKVAHDKHELIFTPLASFILNQILDEKPFITDSGNASRTLLMNNSKCDWDEEMLELFGIDIYSLPTIVPSNFNFGNITLGQQTIPLTICTGDQNAVVFSLGTPTSNSIYVNVGTGAFILNVTENKFEISSAKLLNSVIYSDGEKILYAIEGTVNGAGRALNWLASKHLNVQYEPNLTNWMAKYTSPPIFINGIAGVGSPYWLPVVESQFEFETGIEEKFVSVTESILFLITRNIEEIQKLNANIDQIIISGGLANNDSFCQLLADLNNITVVRPIVTEATARGIFHLLTLNQSSQQSIHNSRFFYSASNQAIASRLQRWKSKMQAIIS